jgi:murein DD-endopeptidase MepM/ murein hydrolase activator NlpD
MPGRGITAYFHDGAYRDFYGVPHEAVDIRAYQGSPVVAAAPGVVFKAKDNGFGYNYIAIVHSGGLVTVYGHISEIMVKKDDVVRAGDLIGLSGGMPGTRGAGFMTTGPHLHFEVIDNEVHHDPLDYLPLEPMRLQDVPERYLKEAVQAEEVTTDQSVPKE